MPLLIDFSQQPDAPGEPGQMIVGETDPSQNGKSRSLRNRLWEVRVQGLVAQEEAF
jgi:hypothetical protein